MLHRVPSAVFQVERKPQLGTIMDMHITQVILVFPMFYPLVFCPRVCGFTPTGAILCYTLQFQGNYDMTREFMSWRNGSSTLEKQALGLIWMNRYILKFYLLKHFFFPAAKDYILVDLKWIVHAFD